MLQTRRSVQSFEARFPNRHNVNVRFTGIRPGGNMDTRFGSDESVTRNRAELYRTVGLTATDTAWIKAEGKDKIVDIDQLHADGHSPDSDGSVNCDGLITTRLNQGLALFPADCVPMLAYSREEPFLGLVHTGRSGAELGIHTDMVWRMENQYGLSKEDIWVFFGPSISSESYVYPELSDDLAADERWAGFIHENWQGFHLDLRAFVIHGLLNAGLSEEQIRQSSQDTGDASQRYFSHRRRQRAIEAGGPIEQEGRNGFVAVMRKN